MAPRPCSVICGTCGPRSRADTRPRSLDQARHIPAADAGRASVQAAAAARYRSCRPAAAGRATPSQPGAGPGRPSRARSSTCMASKTAPSIRRSRSAGVMSFRSARSRKIAQTCSSAASTVSTVITVPTSTPRYTALGPGPGQGLWSPPQASGFHGARTAASSQGLIRGSHGQTERGWPCSLGRSRPGGSRRCFGTRNMRTASPLQQQRACPGLRECRYRGEPGIACPDYHRVDVSGKTAALPPPVLAADLGHGRLAS
jgi:hypothetical protein